MYNLENYNFGTLLRQIRKAKKLSIKDLAEKIGKAPSTVYKYEDGIIVPDLITVLDICNALDIEIEKFVNNENSIEKIF